MVMNLFAAMFEWGGLIPFYSVDLGNHLRGWDITCTGFVGTPWYVYIGSITIAVTLFIFCLQYFIVDSTKFNKAKHWWMFAAIAAAINFVIAFSIPYNDLTGLNICKDLKINMSDCLGFAASNAIWTLLILIGVTVTPLKSKSNQCRNTTFWKP